MGSSLCYRFYYGNATITEAQREELLGIIETDDPDGWDHPGCELWLDNTKEDDPFPKTIDWCKQNGVSWELHTVDDIEVSWIDWWRPGMVEPIGVIRSIDGEPCVSFSSLQDAYNDGTVRKLLDKMPPDIEPLVIEGVEDGSPGDVSELQPREV